MTRDPFNLREQRDSVDDASEARATPDTTTPEERKYWSEHYQAQYRRENEAKRLWEAEHPEIVAEAKADYREKHGDLDSDIDQSLLDDLFGK